MDIKTNMENKEQWEEEFDKVWSGYNPEEDSKGLDYRLKQLFKEQIEKAEERVALEMLDHITMFDKLSPDNKYWQVQKDARDRIFKRFLKQRKKKD